MDSQRRDGTASSSTFQLDVSSAGAVKLKHAVKAKLSEFMGSYTDDVLAEYVVVLVGHGKHQAQAIADLEAFLGDQSKAFVSWLWDHLSVNQSSYLKHPSEPVIKKDTGNNGRSSKALDLEPAVGDEQTAPQHMEGGKMLASVVEVVTPADTISMKAAKYPNEEDNLPSGKSRNDNYGSRHGDDHLLPSDEYHTWDQARGTDVKRTRSPEPWFRRGRGRVEERQQHKRDGSPPRVKAPRRLLESAVRDAVAPGRIEFGFKRLRSVVSAEVDNSDFVADTNGRHNHLKSRLDLSKKGTKVLPAMAVALKAAAAAAEDVNNSSMKASKGRLTGSVWDRLGNRSSERFGMRDNEILEPVTADVDNIEVMEDRWVDVKNAGTEEVRLGKRHKWRKVSDRLGKGPAQDDDEIALPSDGGPGATGYVKNKKLVESEWPNSTGGSMGRFEERSERDQDFEDSVNLEDGRLFRYGTSRDPQDHNLKRSQETSGLPYRQVLGQHDKAAHSLQQNTVSGTSGVVALSEKLPTSHLDHNARSQQFDNVDSPLDLTHDLDSQFSKDGPSIQKSITPSSIGVDTNDVLEMKKRMRQVQLEMTKLRAKQAEVSKEVQKVVSAPGSGLKARSQEEINAHSVCVTNIHFAATKEAIGAHFTPCGEIVRVTLLMDPATGKPKGSAYVEFSSKDGVAKAMNMNDSSLLSRTLKVVRKDAADPNSPPAVVRPPHGPPFPSARAPNIGKFPRAPARRPISIARPFSGTPHLQWKRETSSASGTNGSPNFGHTNGSTVTPPGRIAAASVIGDRYGLGPIRVTRSMSYVRPAPYTPRETPPAVQEQKVAN